MSEHRQPSQHAPQRPAWALRVDWGAVLLVFFLVVGAAFYLQSISRFFMYDDEGGYAYAAWRVSLGEVPYRDFLTPQMPGFLYWGGLLVRLFGRSFVALRVPSVLATLASAWLLYAIDRRILGRTVALAAVGLFLIDTNVFHNAHFYRPEAYMLLLNLAGIYCLVLSEERAQMRYLCLGGLFFGLSVCLKLFGFLSLVGCMLYLLYAGWRKRRPLRRIVAQAAALGLPVALLACTVSLIFCSLTPHFFNAVLEHHTMQGAGLSAWGRVAKALRFFGNYAWYQPVLVLLLGWGAWQLRRERALASLLLWQLPTVLSFGALSRSLMTRHLTYLAPAMATLVALALMRLVQGRWRVWRLQARWHYQALALVLTLLALWPGAKLTAVDSSQRDMEPLRLAALIQQLTSPDDAVMADFPGINFAAGRRSTYWAAGISGGAAESGQIRGTMLNEEIERYNVAMVLINTRWGAHQMTEMLDYPVFRRYVQDHFALVDKYHCAYQQLEVYTRNDVMPLQPGINFQDQVALTGVRLAQAEVTAGSTLAIDTRWQALAAMPHDYHVSLRLVDAGGHRWAQMDESLVEEFSHRVPGQYWEVTDSFRPSAWEARQVVLQEHKLPVGAEVPAGSYYLVAKVYDLETGYALAARPGQGPVLPDGDTVIAAVRVRSAAVLAPEAVPMSRRLGVQLGEGLELVGARSLPREARAGRPAPIVVYWRAGGPLAEGYQLEWRLRAGEVVSQSWRQEIAPGLAASEWRAGDLVLGHYLLTLRDDLPEGPYDLELVLVDGAGREAGAPLRLAEGLVIRARRDPAKVLAGIQTRLRDIRFGGQVELLGYDLASREVAAGGKVKLALYWGCVARPAKDYKVFTHLLDRARQIVGQVDALPEGGLAPTSGWQVGDVVVDRYEIPVEAAAGAGTLEIEVGLYDPLTGQRLALAGGEDHLILPDTVTVR